MNQEYKVAKAYALKILRREELAEEIAQEVLITRWQRDKDGKHVGGIKWQVVDAIREYYGRSKKGEVNRRQFEVLARGGPEELLDQDFDKHSLGEWSDRRDNDRHERLDFRNRIRFRTPQDELIYDMCFINEVPQVEVAHLLGVSESAVCHHVRHIKKSIEKAVIVEKFLSKIVDDHELDEFKLEVDWIKL